MSKFEEIYERIINRMTNPASKIEGTWSSDNAQAVANELAKMYSEDIDTILDKAFVSTAVGEWLDLACADYGMYRNEATYAEVNLKVKGEVGSYTGIIAASDEINFLLDDFTISNETEVYVRAVCQTKGSDGNVLENTVNRVINSDKIISVKNENAAEGGYDLENDKSFRERTIEKISDPPTSGNISHYRSWALDVTGVEKVRVYPLARGNGTVDIAIVADNNTKASNVLIENVKEYVDNVRPIGADILVQAAIPVSLLVEAVVMVKDGYTTKMIQEQLFSQLDNYVKNIPFSNLNISEVIPETLISYVKIADLLFSCEGIEDVESYTVNSQNKSFRLGEREFPIVVMPKITIYGG